MDTVKGKVIEFYKRIQSNDQTMIKLHEKMNVHKHDTDDDPQTISSVKFPIYYLFDHDIDKNIGASVNHRTNIRDLLDLDKLFHLDNGTIHNVSTSGHSTILYNFRYNRRNYIYYSNSGLGIRENQLFNDKNKTTSCRIFYITNNDLWIQIPIDITQTITAVKNIIKEDIVYFT